MTYFILCSKTICLRCSDSIEWTDVSETSGMIFHIVKLIGLREKNGRFQTQVWSNAVFVKWGRKEQSHIPAISDGKEERKHVYWKKRMNGMEKEGKIGR